MVDIAWDPVIVQTHSSSNSSKRVDPELPTVTHLLTAMTMLQFRPNLLNVMSKLHVLNVTSKFTKGLHTPGNFVACNSCNRL